jgi:phosphatidate phosphatase APP1
MLASIGRALRGMARMAVSSPGIGLGRYSVVLQPYRGYGSREEVFLMGRVFREPRSGARAHDLPARRDVTHLAGLLLRRGVGNATLAIEIGAARRRMTTDRHGYFRLRMRLPERPPSDRLWHRIDIELVRPVHAVARGEFFVPPDTARFVTISDIDDTVMETTVDNPVAMFQRLFLQTAEKRVAFPGVAALYRALHLGLSGRELNPMLYVSRAPWSIYEMLDRFFRLHEIPVGPILFLREWGLTLQHPWPHRIRDHKLNLIRKMLSRYEDLPFILIGDSTQQDPEIYTQVVREHPDRVLAVYIRNVTRAPERRAAIEALAEQVVEAGSSLILAADSFVMAQHAAQHEWISSDALIEVLRERVEQQGETDLKPTQEVTRPSPRETAKAVEQGELGQAVEAETGEASPPNVVVRPEREETDERIERPASHNRD